MSRITVDTLFRNGIAWLPCVVVAGSDPTEVKISVELPNFELPMSSYVRLGDDVHFSRGARRGWVRVSVLDRKKAAGTEYAVVRFPGETVWRGAITPVPMQFFAKEARPQP